LKYFLVKKDGSMAKFRILIILFILSVLIFLSSSAAISIKYDISPYYSAKQQIRNGILSGIYISTLIYDPASTKIASIGPENDQRPIDYENYIRIEEYFKREKIQEGFHVMKIHNEKITRSRYHFSYQPYEEPKLAELRNYYKLDDVIAPARNEFEAMVLLRGWARSQFRRSDYQPKMVNFDALKVLKSNLRNKDNKECQPDQYRPCHFFPLFYSQTLLSMGYQVRPTQIAFSRTSKLRKDFPHGTTEVWSNQYKKWVTMDADLNLHYEKDEVPLNLLEVHNARYEKDTSNFRIVRGIQTSGDFEWKKKIDIKDMIKYHSYFKITDMRNDWMTNHYFRGHPMRSDRASLFWVDERMPEVFNLGPKTNIVNDFYWTLNQAEIFVKKESQIKDELSLAFKTVTPNFKNFEIWLDDSKKIVSTKPVFIWKLHEGNNKLSVCSVNKFGIHGIPSSVEGLLGT